MAVKPIDLDGRKNNLKRRVRRHLWSLGFTKDEHGSLKAPGTSKEIIRNLHARQRADIVKESQKFIEHWYPKLEKYFASGSDIEPAKIQPRLELVEGQGWRASLFRLASLTWSVPVSAGFGRRLRFLVWDKQNGKLIGILAIGDPVFNMSVRDKFIDWDTTDRSARLVNVMDAYVLGAVAPYNMLLGGKMVACLARSREVLKAFSKRYGKSIGVISKKNKNPRLLAITTSSSMGRSSLYNRLSLDGQRYFQSLGYTGGWGHFHVPDTLFSEMRDYLGLGGEGRVKNYEFGQGPNWRIRTIRAAMDKMGFKGDMLKHGIQREVFISLLADNAQEVLSGKTARPTFTSLKCVDEIGKACVTRWMLPRSLSRPEYMSWNKASIKELIITGAVRESLKAQGSSRIKAVS